MTFYTKLEGQLIGRGLEFRWEVLTYSVAFCFTDKIPTEKLKKTRIIYTINRNKGSRLFWYLSTSVVGIFVREISKPSSFSRILIRILSEIRILGSDTNSNLKSFTSSKFCNNFDRNSIRKTSWLRLITISMWSAIRMKKMN